MNDPESNPQAPASGSSPASAPAPEALPQAEDAAGRKSKKRRPAPTTFWGKVWHEWVKPLGLVILILLTFRSSIADWNDVPSGSMRPTILEGDRIVVNKLAYGFNTPFNGPKIDIPFTGISFDNPLSFMPRYLWSAPKRGDIVTFWNPVEGIRMVKRIVGIPGDTIQVINGRLTITDRDGNEVPVTYEKNHNPPVTAEHIRINGQPTLQPLDSYFENLGGIRHYVQFLQRIGNYRDVDPVTLADPDGLADDEYWMVGDNRDNSKDSRYYETVGTRVQGKHITGKAKFIAVSFDGSWLNPAFGRWFRSFDGEAQAQ